MFNKNISLFLSKLFFFALAFIFSFSAVSLRAQENSSIVENNSPYTAKSSPLPTASILSEQPQLKLAYTEHDFGLVKPGSVVSHAFLVENMGNADLEIITVEPGCSCAVAEYDKIIKPGKTGKVVINVNINKNWAGHRFKRQSVIVSNDPAQRNTYLMLTAQVLENK